MDERLVAALLSIQFHSLGREGQIGRPPTMLMSQDLEPLPLDEALDYVRATGTEDTVREVMWTLLRGSPHPPFREPDRDRHLRYPPAVRFYCRVLDFKLEAFDAKRCEYRNDARLFAAAIVAFALEQKDVFEALRAAIVARGSLFVSDFLREALGETALEFLNFLGTTQKLAKREGERRTPQEWCALSLRKFEEEVGVSLETYVGEFADTAAFMEIWKERIKGRLGAPASVATAYPAFTVALQDPKTLTTSVTATSLVRANDFSLLVAAMDPRSWGGLSRWFRTVEYLDADWGYTPKGTPHGPKLLREVVDIRSHKGGTDMGYFENRLWVQLRVNPDKDGDAEKGWATLDFSLAESVRSRLLWDERPGGLLVNTGWTKLRCIRPGLWRLTARKELRFADRTPQSNRKAPFDFGQTLNLLSPSVLSSWLENDIYSSSTGRQV